MYTSAQARGILLLSSSSPSALAVLSLSIMSDMDMLAAMGISGFGKKVKQRQLDPNRFEKNKRGDTVRGSPWTP